jgi:hypothetical protein
MGFVVPRTIAARGIRIYMLDKSRGTEFRRTYTRRALSSKIDWAVYRGMPTRVGIDTVPPQEPGWLFINHEWLDDLEAWGHVRDPEGCGFL